MALLGGESGHGEVVTVVQTTQSAAPEGAGVPGAARAAGILQSIVLAHMCKKLAGLGLSRAPPAQAGQPVCKSGPPQTH